MKTITLGAVAALMISVSSANAATVGFDFGNIFQRTVSQVSTTSTTSGSSGGGFLSFFASLSNSPSSGGSSGGAFASLLSQIFGQGQSTGSTVTQVETLTCDDCNREEVVEVRETPSEVPLPAAGFLLIGGIAGLGLVRRRKG